MQHETRQQLEEILSNNLILFKINLIFVHILIWNILHFVVLENFAVLFPYSGPYSNIETQLFPHSTSAKEFEFN